MEWHGDYTVKMIPATLPSGTMTRGELELIVSVVPDSGTGELKGISGKMKIDIVEGKHFYTFDYVINDE